MIRVIGAGLPRTGTTTLKAALGSLLGGRCHHMTEVFEHPESMAGWQAALDGDTGRLPELLTGYVAAVDWPSSAFWPELAELHPEAPILLSLRDDGPTWWGSMDATVIEYAHRRRAGGDEFLAMAMSLWGKVFGETLDDDPVRGAAAYDEYVAHVRATAPKERLVEWNAKDGWEPLCSALGVAVPDEPLPHLNPREDWVKADAEAESQG
ncbi:sulfotransferase family protein [Phytomonospora endophytica]|uniref:Sulfotransferase family protein n=1 Tax=Phytomonospora endophytica TaxID=714109 RepID=A0A841FVG8_9ACTN|nr:sulfotransferase family protein [Phytomonospora endophytica]MBB6038763.1 hypothetical protein [Phytomonospora endophytica]GIG68441.1 sulfotransferase family protein [Phytomonospora endophytica]